jgi:hypothetical protein
MGNIFSDNYIRHVIEKCDEYYDEHKIHLIEPVCFSESVSELKKQIEKIKPLGVLKLYSGNELIIDDTVLINDLPNKEIKFEVEPSQEDIYLLDTFRNKVKDYLKKNNDKVINVSIDFCYDKYNNKICSFYHVIIPSDKYLELKRKGHHKFFKEYPPRIKLNRLDVNLSGTIRIEYLSPYGNKKYFEL